MTRKTKNTKYEGRERFSGPKDSTRITKYQAAKLRAQGGFKPHMHKKLAK